MFGYVTASLKELNKEAEKRYGAVYCGICRRIRLQSGQMARLGLRYDMAFLALLLMSLYEPEETAGEKACNLHPIRKRPWVDNKFIQYAADMNVALSYYNCLDDWEDDGKYSARLLADQFGKHLPEIDYIITHEPPLFARESIARKLPLEADYRFPAVLDQWYALAAEAPRLKKWYFGHMHVDQKITPKLRSLYNEILLLTEERPICWW